MVFFFALAVAFVQALVFIFNFWILEKESSGSDKYILLGALSFPISCGSQPWSCPREGTSLPLLSQARS